MAGFVVPAARRGLREVEAQVRIRAIVQGKSEPVVMEGGVYDVAAMELRGLDPYKWVPYQHEKIKPAYKAVWSRWDKLQVK